MTEPTELPPVHAAPVKKKRGMVLPIALAIVAIAVAGFIASRAGLDKALVKQELDRFIVELKEKGRAQGRDLDVTYGDLEVVGSFASKHVVIHDPVLHVKPLERKPQPDGAKKEIDAIIVTTPTLAIYPQAADLSALRVEVADPVNVAAEDAPNKSLLNVKSDMPLVVAVAHKKVGEVQYTQVDYKSPTQMLFTYLNEQQATGGEEQTPTVVPVYESLQVTMAKDGGMTSNVANDDSGLGEMKLTLHDVVVTPQVAPEGAVKVAEITVGWSNALNEKNLNAVHAFVKFGPVTSDNTAVPYLPLVLDMDATYEGMMTKSPQSIAQAQTQESSMVLKHFALTTKDANLTASANFAANTADVLPVGTANVSLTNVPYVLGELRKAGLLNAGNEPLVNSLLALTTGTPVEQLKDVVIPIERARGGAFKIGNTTFEELFAAFLKQAMQGRSAAAPAASATGVVSQPQAPLVPALPPADKPKSAPISVPDHGVRG